ncbi:uncharacterized protein LOC119996887 [Tripterygium wilfordii]|uniref:uncharacterized protein LOC119996887 n=1 Tax=Tripterygium wilfordii TaxID=458696 RepID=UPI0018F7FF6D|nr:uncharacterized protein LOC119996887 [Tripterygium wilfordii]
MIFAAVIWTIWTERNKVIFDDAEVEWSNVLYLVFIRYGLWLKAINISIPYSGPELMAASDGVKFKILLNKAPRPVSIWVAPPTSHLKWNTDGSSRLDKVGIGGVLRDSSGNFLCIFSGPVGNLDATSAEMEAIRKALEISVAHGSSNGVELIVESDSHNSVSWLKKGSSNPWSMDQDCNAITNLTKVFAAVNFVHIWREANGVADFLAKKGVDRQDLMVSWLV